MKFKFGIVYLVMALIIIAGISVFVYNKFFDKNLTEETTRYDFFGTELVFRHDLRTAQNISVYPDEGSILNKVWSPDITKLNIVYVPTVNASEENGALTVNIFEIRFKLDVAYRNPNFNWINEFASEELQSFENISISDDTLVIALYRPSQSDRTAVELDGNVVSIKGTTPLELDLATIKFLMSALNITV